MAIKHSPTQAEISDLITKAGQGRKGIDEVYHQLNNRGCSKHNMDKFYINKIY